MTTIEKLLQIFTNNNLDCNKYMDNVAITAESLEKEILALKWPLCSKLNNITTYGFNHERQ